MASTWAATALEGAGRTSLSTKECIELSDSQQHIALIQGCEGFNEQDLRARLAPYGSVAWCNSVDEGRFLVRFVTQEGMSAAIKALDGTNWLGNTFKIAPYSVGHLLPGMQQDSPMARLESISAVLPDQLDYFDLLMAEESNQQQQQGLAAQAAAAAASSSMFQGSYPELEPCHPEWNPGAGTDMLTPLEDEALSMDDSPLHSFTSGNGPSTCQLWTQRSIGAVARMDLAKFAALQNMVQQHSSSTTPTPCLLQAGSVGINSPWGSFTAGSSSMEAAGGLAGLARRVSSPTGHSASLTPRSNCGSSAADAAVTMQQQQMQAQMVGRGPSVASNNNNSGWPTHLMQLPSDLGLGDGLSGDDSAGFIRLQQSLLATQQQQQQQQQGNSVSADPMSALMSAGLMAPPGFGSGSGGYGAGDLMGRNMESSGDMCGLMAGPAGGVAVPPPPPPPMQQQHGMVAPPPPPPPARSNDGYGYGGSSDGRLSGTSSPVPAPPPPRALTPGGGPAPSQVWGSPAASPRFQGPVQPQSPSNGFRPPRTATRLFQPGMSNLGHCAPGGPPGPLGLPPQHSYDQANSSYMPQQQQQQGQQQPQQPLYRVGSPVGRSGVAPIVPPPPPPGMPPPGYAAASAAAAAACGSPVPPVSPAGGRAGSFGGPLSGMFSAPGGLLETAGSAGSQAMMCGGRGPLGLLGPLASQGSGGAALCDRPGSGNHAAAAAGSRGGAAGYALGPALKADGALFVQELLQLLKGGAAAGSIFLSNLRDLLECALAAGEWSTGDTSIQSGVTVIDKAAGEGLAGTEDGAAGEAAKKAAPVPPVPAAPVDAAAFLGMLQEAAAPLMAAAAAAAAAARTSGPGQQASRRGSQRMSEANTDASSSCGASTAGGSGEAGLRQGQVLEPGKGLKPIRTDRGSTAGGEDLEVPAGLLLRHQLSARGGSGSPGSPLFYPLHPRTTTHGGRDCGSSSCGGAAPGTPHGTPMLLVPQTLPELLSARAALMRLMVSAHGFVQSPAYARMSSRLQGVEEVYDSMHDNPVVLKRRKCKEMAAMREVIKQDQGFTQAVSSVSSLRNHIYSLSRKVLIGYGHVEGLPVDLLLGGLTSELAAILTDPSGQVQQGSDANGSGSDPGSARGAGAGCGSSAGDGSELGNGGSSGAADVSSNTQGCLPQPVLEFFTSVLPLPKLALLVFTEFVPVDPAPCCMTPAPGGPAAGGAAADASGAASNGGFSSNGGNGGNGGSNPPARTSNLRDRRSSAHAEGNGGNSSNAGGFDGREGSGSGFGPHERRGGGYRYSRDGENGERNGHHGERNGHGQLNRSRGSSFNSGSGGAESSSGGSGNGSNSGGKQRSARRSQQCEFDLAAEAAALEAAATAAGPLVAAAVCDLPTGRRRRSSTGA